MKKLIEFIRWLFRPYLLQPDPPPEPPKPLPPSQLWAGLVAMAAARQGFVYTDLVDYLLYGQSNSPHKTDFERPDKMDLCGKAGWPDRNIAARAQEFLKKELYALAATGVRIQALLDDSSGRDRVVQLLLHESMLNPVVEVEEK